MSESGGGSIINTASSAGVIGIPGCDVYTASKGATISLTRSLAVEYRPQGVRVNCIAPAGIRTPMMSQSNLEDDSFDETRFLCPALSLPALRDPGGDRAHRRRSSPPRNRPTSTAR